MSVRAGLAEIQMGRNYFKFMWWFRTQFFMSCQTEKRISASSWLLAGDHLSFLPCESLHVVAYFMKASKKESTESLQADSDYICPKVITDV